MLCVVITLHLVTVSNSGGALRMHPKPQRFTPGTRLLSMPEARPNGQDRNHMLLARSESSRWDYERMARAYCVVNGVSWSVTGERAGNYSSAAKSGREDTAWREVFTSRERAEAELGAWYRFSAGKNYRVPQTTPWAVTSVTDENIVR